MNRYGLHRFSLLGKGKIMGMELVGRRLPADNLLTLLEDPSAIEELLYAEPSAAAIDSPDSDVDLGNAWHGIQFLLNGSAWGFGSGAGAAVLGGEPIGEDDGYGSARLFRPEEVREIAAGLDALDEAALRERFDPVAMKAAEIYPGVWVTDDIGALLTAYANLRTFYRSAADAGDAVLLVVT